MSATDVRFNSDRSCLLNVDKLPGNMRQSDLDHLAMLKARAKKESGNFGLAEFLQIALFIGITCAFTVAFYKIAMLEREVASLERRHQMITDTIHQTQNDQPQPPTDDRRSSLYDRFGFGRHTSDHGHYPSRSYSRGYLDSRLPNRDSVPQPDVVVERTTAPVIDQGQESSNYSSDLNMTRNRSRRSISDQLSAEENVIGTKQPEYEEHFARHLLPAAETDADRVEQGKSFKWKDASGESPALERSGFELLEQMYLRAPVAGFYYLYSQVTYSDNITRSVGHKIVQWDKCGNGDMSLLMSTSITQQHLRRGSLGATSHDSAYVGGVAYLMAGDIVAVRPMLGTTKFVTVSRTDKNTFFGGFLISKDNVAPPIDEICL